jgi:hypothetical protein
VEGRPSDHDLPDQGEDEDRELSPRAGQVVPPAGRVPSADESTSSDDGSAKWGTTVKPEVVGDVYTVLATRRTAFDTLMWQVPALGLTAQAFLLTIALDAGSSQWARYIAAGLALVITLVAMQTMAKHRANERTDSLMLQHLEETLIGVIMGVPPHERSWKRATNVHNPLFRERYISKVPSFNLWMVGLAFFAAAAVTIIILTMIDPEIFQRLS